VLKERERERENLVVGAQNTLAKRASNRVWETEREKRESQFGTAYKSWVKL
jgi:hypothetical protein